MKFFEIEYLERQKSSPMPDKHCHRNYFELYFLVEGHIQAIFNDSFIDMSAPSFLVIPQNEDHKNSPGPGKRYLINVSPDNISKFELKYLWKMSKKAYNLPVRAIALLEEINKLATENETDRQEKQSLVFSYLLYLMLNEQEKYDNSVLFLEKPDNKFLIAKIVNYIDHNFQKKITYDTLSKEFSVSPSTIRKHFKIIMNKTIGEYILQVRIENAKSLLAWTNKSIDKIASETGFYNASYMAKVFNKELGISPQQYRKHKKM